MLRVGVLTMAALLASAHADDTAVELAMTCFDESKQEWRSFEKVGAGIRMVKDGVPGELEPIHEADDENLRYVVQLKTYTGIVTIEYDYGEKTVVKDLMSGPQRMNCE
ncbi:MAG: hypothetical protein QGF53_15870 [Alphaproteobacteria bacterium]|jgi:hypothetical protein|nr:hypothetical protein [Alphaproteobacteria bacterium]